MTTSGGRRDPGYQPESDPPIGVKKAPREKVPDLPEVPVTIVKPKSRLEILEEAVKAAEEEAARGKRR